jgi:exonuclease VII large subunit
MSPVAASDSLCQVRKVVEAQLDTTLPRSVMARRLQQTAAKIEYWQRRAEEAARAHCKRRRKELRRAGIDLRRAIRCPKWV